ncbi:hypothetical protein [Mycobacterium shottsii]|nr:hypothetical protein [Mycobacterium shottsii]EPQ79876.1 hypothetical protein MMEU_0400 [Mycobacterium marinum str. Europe]
MCCTEQLAGHRRDGGNGTRITALPGLTVTALLFGNGGSAEAVTAIPA